MHARVSCRSLYTKWQNREVTTAKSTNIPSHALVKKDILSLLRNPKSDEIGGGTSVLGSLGGGNSRCLSLK
ncbi:hypothetical protein TGRH88_070630 [Toxoplasma gondii]|uniref:Uncharacterized protein n=1 Tax=Toxoplasma gondii TaxID=5811 RepID=A0A7J6K1G8_TOXGO|nr:hypothetical protein TGRH88_070630 [Toxoplasma gondii]